MANRANCISILQITDLHILPSPKDTLLGVNTHDYFRAVLDLAYVNKPHYDLILLTGDLAQEPCSSSYQQILAGLLPRKTRCICLPGNHDDVELMQQILTYESVSCQKQLFLDNWQLICLNSQIPGSAGGCLPDQELSFLQQCLHNFPDLYSLIAVHHHCLETQSAWMDTMMIENSPLLFSILSAYPNAKVITTGHIHQMMDQSAGGVRVLGTPSTCFQFKPDSHDFGLDITSPGYRTIDLYADGGIETQVVRLPEPLVGLQFNSQGY